MKTGLTQKANAEELKKFFTTHKGALKQWDCWTTSRPYEEIQYHTAPQQYMCKETGVTFEINGIGKEKVRINGHWYSYKTMEKALKQGYKQNSQTLNSFLCYFIDDYEYHHYTEEDFRSVISNRKHAQYLTKQDVPKYIPVGKLKKLCNIMELPILSKQLL